MKKLTALLLVFAVLTGLTACAGGKAAPDVDMEPLYKTMEEKLPAMLLLDETDRLDLMGLRAEDCDQAVVAICAEGLLADEIWLIRAKDASALERIEKLGQSRLDAKAQETENYLPEQALVVRQGITLTRGLYYGLIVSPEAESLKAAFLDAVK